MATSSRTESNRGSNRPRGRPNRPAERAGKASISEQNLKAVITKSDPDSAELLVREAKSLGTQLNHQDSKLATSQIRAIFGEVRQIDAQLSTIDLSAVDQERALRKLILLKPKMAYRAHRDQSRQGNGVRKLVEVLDPAIDLVVRESDLKIQIERFHRFVDFFEAILAYHRAAGGK